ncbi:MAG TPA: sigma-70 family RNA polymerase sigma factor [Acidobacteriota bacterium]|nr:sigma-70 family RNA polymerase sigma factor [Acidobacteriota bacterium]
MEIMLSEVRTLSSPKLGVREDVQGILIRARAGEADAFHAIFIRYSKPVLSFIYSLLGNRAQAEELTQETFIRAHRRLSSMHSDSQLSTWLFGIARNVAREAIKEKYRDQRKVVLDGAVSRTLRDSRTGPDDRLIAGELNQAIYNALTSLTEDYRAVFVLKIMHRMRYVEISRITGSSVGKLKTDLHRARMQMQQSLKLYLGGETAGTRGGS